MSKEKKIYLNEREMPTQWYNIVADMVNKPLPPLHPGTKQPIGPEALAPLFPMSLIQQEVSTDRWIDIPEEVQDLYKIWRQLLFIVLTTSKKHWIHLPGFILKTKV